MEKNVKESDSQPSGRLSHLLRLQPDLIENEDETSRNMEEDPGELTLAASGLQKQLKLGKEGPEAMHEGEEEEDPAEAYLKLQSGMSHAVDDEDPITAAFLKAKTQRVDDDDQDVKEMQRKLKETRFEEVIKAPEKETFDQVQLDTWMSPLLDRIVCAPFIYPIFLLMILLVQLYQVRLELYDDINILKSKFQSGCFKVNSLLDSMEQWPKIYVTQLQLDAENVLKNMIQQLAVLMGFAVSLGKNIMFMLVSAQTTIYKCMASTMLVSSTQFLTDMAQTLITGWNGVIGSLEQGFNGMIQALNSQLSNVLGLDFTHIFGTSIGTKIEIPSISALTQSLQIPMGFQFDLQNAFNSMPSLDQIFTDFENVLSQPFALLNETLTHSLYGLQSGIQLNLDFNPPPNNGYGDFCNDARMMALINKFQEDIDRFFSYGVFALFGAIGLCFLYSTTRIWTDHALIKHRINNITSLKKSDMMWELLDPITFKIVDKMDWLVCLVRRFKSVEGATAGSVKAHLTRESKRNLARIFRFLGYPPAVVFILFCVTTLALLYIQLSLIQAWKLQPEIVITPFRTLFQDLSSEYSFQANARIQQLFESYLVQFNSLTHQLAADINNVVVDKYSGIIHSINGTLDGVMSQMMHLIDQTFSQVPAVQVLISDLIQCFIYQKSNQLQLFLNTLISATTFKSPQWSLPSTSYFDTIVQNSSHDWGTTSAELILEFLDMYEKRVLKQITFTWYMTLFAFGPGICGVVFVVYTYGIMKIPLSRVTPSSFRFSYAMNAWLHRVYGWHAKQWKGGYMKRFGICFLAILFSPVYILIGLLASPLAFSEKSKIKTRRSGKTNSKAIAKKDIKLKFATGPEP